MCLPACQKKIAESMKIGRRDFLKSLGAAGAALAAAPVVMAAPATHSNGVSVIRFREVVDLTHTLFELFPTYFRGPTTGN